mmetsp:Transcript_70075/g.152371  ORF Transcript_70075/g.152371 Transcript_70075/m.152371 type:complete len:270 (-) Transcript_70075:365-1174(-)
MLHCDGRLRCEGLVDLEDVDVVDGKACLAERCRNGIGRANAHEQRVDAHHGVASESADDGESQLLGHGATSQQHQRGAVGDLARVPGRRAAPCLESGLQAAQALYCGARSRALVHRHDDVGGVPILVLDFRGHWHDLVLEVAGFLSCQSLRVRCRRKCVLRLPRDAPLGGHVLRCDAHGRETGGGKLVVHDVCGELIQIDAIRHAIHSHGFNPTCEADVDDTSLDVRGNVCNCLKAAAALPVHSAERDVEGQTSQELRHPGCSSSCPWL